MIEVIPAILTNNIKEVSDKLEVLGDSFLRVQIDIVDGIYAMNKTITPDSLVNLDTDKLLDFHLMVKGPIDWVEKCVRGMADRIIGQIEMMNDQIQFVKKVQEAGLSVGLGLDLETPFENLDLEIVGSLDLVLVMSVKAGFGGQNFERKALEKVRSLKDFKLRNQLDFKICVDGGINEENIRDVYLSGADEVVIGARLFNNNDIGGYVKKLKEKAYG